MDVELADAYIEHFGKRSRDEKAYEAANAAIGPLLGQLPLVGGKPAPAATATSSASAG